LSRFAPPPLKQKSRFMNLADLLQWANMVSYHLAHPHSEARKGITEERMNEKLGWLREYREDLAGWAACQTVIDAALKFIHLEGLSVGTADRLRHRLAAVLSDLPEGHETVDRVREALVDFVEQSEQQLEDGQRAWLSTEILESLFAHFKRLEGQHSKGGFTSLLAAFPALCCPLDPARVRRCLLEVSTTKLKQWVKETVGQTLTALRTTAYHEYALATTG
jgi:hypothetical protein